MGEDAAAFGDVLGSGWVPPRRAEDGVYYAAPSHDADISYPIAGFGSLGQDGGSGYWFDHRARAIARVIEVHNIRSMWEIGAGTGALARQLRPLLSGRLVAVEPLARGAAACASHGITSIRGTLQELHLPDASIESIGAFDVLEHLEDPDEVLNEAHRVLRPGGIFVVTVPAFQWLWGDTDDAAGHFRRYTRSTLTEAFLSNGFTDLGSEYLFASLVPLAAVTRALPHRLGRRRSIDQSLTALESQLDVSPYVDKVASTVLHAESAVSRHIRLPFGLSILGAFRAAD